MPQFDVFGLRGRSGLFVSIQHDALVGHATTVLIPLVPIASASLPVSRLNPVFNMDGEQLILLTQAMSAVRNSELERKGTSLSHERDRIVSAIDFLVVGF